MGRKTKVNRTTTPELVAQCNPENLKLKHDFLNYLASIQRSEGTIYNYNSDLNIFFVWCLQHCGDKAFIDIKKRDIIAFQSWMILENQNSPARVKRMKSALSSLSNYIENIMDEEYSGYRPVVRKIEDPVNMPVRKKTVLTEEQLHYLLEELTERGREDIACGVALAAFSGRRKSELMRYKVSYFKDEYVVFGSLYKTPEPIRTKGRGLGKYIYCYTVKPDFQPYFDRWMMKRRQLGIDSEWLLVVRHGNEWVRATSPTFTSWMGICSRILGVDVYAHSFRHFFVSRMVSLKIPDAVVKDIMGWESVDMVKVYDDTDASDRLGDYFDENGIKPPSPSFNANSIGR